MMKLNFLNLQGRCEGDEQDECRPNAQQLLLLRPVGGEVFGDSTRVLA